MRLTEKNSGKWNNKYHLTSSLFSENTFKAIDKLGQYEDIDESPEHLAKIKKAFDITKRINFDIVYREQFDEWTLFIVITTQDGEYLEPVTFGEGKKEYDLLNEVLL